MILTLTDPPSPARSAVPPDRLLVRDLVLPARVGIYDREKAADQRLRINLEMAVAGGDGPRRDEIGAVVSYEDAINLIAGIVAAGHVNLLETLAETIAGRLLADPRVHSVTLRLEKLDAFPQCAAVGVEITRSR